MSVVIIWQPPPRIRSKYDVNPCSEIGLYKENLQTWMVTQQLLVQSYCCKILLLPHVPACTKKAPLPFSPSLDVPILNQVTGSRHMWIPAIFPCLPKWLPFISFQSKWISFSLALFENMLNSPMWRRKHDITGHYFGSSPYIALFQRPLFCNPYRLPPGILSSLLHFTPVAEFKM